MQQEHDDDEIIYVSKSEMKRESHALQALGEELVKLPDAQLATIPMPEQLADAVALARRIKARGGRKRQLQYIGKIMRKIDPEPIQQAMAGLKNEAHKETAKLHRLEQWRDRLIAEGDTALAPLLDEYPYADRQHLRQLIRNAQREQKQNKPPKSSRELFRYLRELTT
ncbi:MAG: ribosome biogenesis factor YjgA [Pseudomonadota bacterium]